jgi:hypothetical protein
MSGDVLDFTNLKISWHHWLTPVILATQEAEIRRITVQSQPRANSSQDPISKNPSHTHTYTQNRAGGVAQGEGPEFNPQYTTHTKKEH